MLGVLTQFAQYNGSEAATNIVALLIGLFVVIVFLVVGIGLLVMWIITLIHVIQHEDVPDRTLWIVLHLLVGQLIGPIYWFIVKKPYDAKHKHK